MSEEQKADIEVKAPALVEKEMTNTSFHTRRWDTIARTDDRTDADGNVIAQAGSTLELDPGESATVVVPDNFEDSWLKEAKVGAPKRTARSKTRTTET